METQEILKQCTVEGNVVKLPNIQLERKVYTDVAKAIEKIGGKWKGGKVQGFVFATNPADLLQQIANVEKRNLKKEFQFFETPADLADELVFQAQIEPYHQILEPSAGQGAIIKAINRVFDKELAVDAYELMPQNQEVLKKMLHVTFLGDDFLQAREEKKYDRIIANPPFSNNQDIDHVQKMYTLLNDNGRLVAITSKHWLNCNNKKETNFSKWLQAIEDNGNYVDVVDIEKGRFKKSGTMIETVMLIIQKNN